jgi:hypothetical protein
MGRHRPNRRRADVHAKPSSIPAVLPGRTRELTDDLAAAPEPARYLEDGHAQGEGVVMRTIARRSRLGISGPPVPVHLDQIHVPGTWPGPPAVRPPTRSIDMNHDPTLPTYAQMRVREDLAAAQLRSRFPRRQPPSQRRRRMTARLLVGKVRKSV